MKRKSKIMNSKLTFFGIFVVIATSLYVEEVKGGTGLSSLRDPPLTKQTPDQPAGAQPADKENENEEKSSGADDQTAKTQDDGCVEDPVDDKDEPLQADVNVSTAAETEKERANQATEEDKPLAEDETKGNTADNAKPAQESCEE